MIECEPQHQTKLFGLDRFFIELINLYKSNKLPNKILLSGPKGIGKSTMAYHFINYVLSKDELNNYDIDNLTINSENQSFKTVINRSNINFSLIDVNREKKNIDINQIRNLINLLNKSSFNKKERFILIDNIEFLNKNSVNALLKVIEEPNDNIFFILINNNKKILPTLSSRCINFKIFLSNKENFDVANKLLNGRLSKLINKDLMNYYFTAGNIYSLLMFAKSHSYDLSIMDIKDFLKILIKDNHYKKNMLIKSLIYEYIETYLHKINSSFGVKTNDYYHYFIRKIYDTKNFNLDEEALFIEFEDRVLNG